VNKRGASTNVASAQPNIRSSRVRRWIAYLWREGLRESWRPLIPVSTRPNPAQWNDDGVTVAWLGHATILINFFGITILTDPVLFSRIGIRIPFLFTLGPKRLTAPPLRVRELPRVDLILLSHAHFDHFDMRSLHKFGRDTQVITAARTRDLLRWTRFGKVTELDWGESKMVETAAGSVKIDAFRVQHWGARLQHDDYRGYNGYVLERKGRRIIFSGDGAMTDGFAQLRRGGPIDIAIMAIGAYEPWIRSHSTPEQAVEMATDAGAEFILPMHHQTFRLSFEPFREPIERFEAALHRSPHRIALREIGETFVLPT
jgi:L-ascorbate metabolism protein UlaG (beta-lactamase superfamily)